MGRTALSLPALLPSLAAPESSGRLSRVCAAVTIAKGYMEQLRVAKAQMRQGRDISALTVDTSGWWESRGSNSTSVVFSEPLVEGSYMQKSAQVQLSGFSQAGRTYVVSILSRNIARLLGLTSLPLSVTSPPAPWGRPPPS